MRRQILWVLAIAIFLALPGVSHAQEATVTGTITDSTGGVLPGVTVTATNTDSGNTFVAVTEQGFTLASLLSVLILLLLVVGIVGALRNPPP